MYIDWDSILVPLWGFLSYVNSITHSFYCLIPRSSSLNLEFKGIMFYVLLKYVNAYFLEILTSNIVAAHWCGYSHPIL